MPGGVTMHSRAPVSGPNFASVPGPGGPYTRSGCTAFSILLTSGILLERSFSYLCRDHQQPSEHIKLRSCSRRSPTLFRPCVKPYTRVGIRSGYGALGPRPRATRSTVPKKYANGGPVEAQTDLPKRQVCMHHACMTAGSIAILRSRRRHASETVESVARDCGPSADSHAMPATERRRSERLR